MLESRLKLPRVILITFLLSLPAFIIPTTSAPVSLYLVITPAIPSIPADGAYHPAFFVTVQDRADASGKPYPLSQPVNMTITSSDERLLKVQTTGSLTAATYYTIVNASSTVTEKRTVEVTVSAPGYQSSKIDAVVEPPAGTPNSLKVTLLPNTILPQKNDVSYVVVTLVDAYGKPTRAREEKEISLFSSNVQIADLAATSVKIPKGEFSVRTNITCKGFPGTSVITASTSGVKTDSSTLTVVGPKPEKLYISTLSRQLVGERSFVFVGVVDSSNKPVKVISPMTVNLFSSNTSVFTLPGGQRITIPAGEWTGMAELQCSGIGSSTIYATAEDLTSQAITITGVQVGNIPYELKLYSLANAFPADERSYTAMVVQLVNKTGYPSRTWTALNVTVSSSQTDIFDTKNWVMIPAGSSYASITATPKYLGTVTVSVGYSGLLRGDATVTVHAPLPTAVTITTPPIPSEGEVDACIVISAGLPVLAQQNTSVVFSSSDAGIGDSSRSATLLKKKYSAYFKVKGSSPGKFFLTASGSGIPSTRQELEVLEVKPSTFALSYVKPIKNYDFPIVVQLVSLLKSAAVTYEPIIVKMASSNLSTIFLPETATVRQGNTEVLLYGRALSTEKTKLTLSSEGFKSQTVEISPAPINLIIKIVSGDRYTTGQTVTIKASATLDNTPVKGMVVYWSGSGLANPTSITDSTGTAENRLTVKEKENIIEASIRVGGMGQFVARKTIIGGLSAYRLEVTSNIQTSISGSGSYTYGQYVSLTAPETVGIPGIVGFLGGTYRFREWQGAVTSTNPIAGVSIAGDQEVISARAIYAEDNSGLITNVAIIAAVAGAAVVLVLFIRRRRMAKASP